ncbi:MAG TPA: response regulator transcription factor, partial [Gammaproteobacteria bacterium]|nr:response regulator transcription factor [Gammaproteobacteria bacterium]
LGSEGFDVTSVHDGVQAVEVIRRDSDRWDAIILDVMLPGMNGFDVLKAIRPERAIPLLMLTARGEDTDTVLGLELGADDYVAKPVSPRVLVARLRALLRRGQNELDASTLKVGDVALDERARKISVNGEAIKLTGAEFNLLALLLKNAGHVVSRETLAADGLGRALTAYDRRIETHMAQIRRKLGHFSDGSARIQTIRGAGYQYVVTQT